MTGPPGREPGDTMASLGPTPRTTLRRHPERGTHDRAVIDAILGEALVCHVAFVDGGAPCALPTTFSRVGDVVYLHGAVGNRMLGALLRGERASLTFTLLDGLVLARSAMHHSMNFRSVVLFGVARAVDDPAEKRAALDAIVEHVVPGRMAVVRPPSPAELAATRVVAFPIEEGSAKVRTGPPLDDPEDLALPCWAGVIPLRLAAGAPEPDPGLAPGIPPPATR